MRLIVAGGGTGGHIFPALSIAKEFISRNGGRKVLFVGARGGMEESLVCEKGFELKLLHATKFKGRGILTKFRSLISLPRTLFDAYRIIREFKPDFVLGVGGYASWAIIVVACFLKIPNGILEQNTVPGLANRILGRFVEVIFLAFPVGGEYFDKKKTIITGNPLRREFYDRVGMGITKSSKFTIMVSGGSQGATRLNSLFLEALLHLKKFIPDVLIIHQTGMKDYDNVIKKYKELGINASVYPFYEKIWEDYATSDLIVSRAGSGIYEFALFGKPSILIPYPYAAYNHQLINAKYFEKNMASVILENGSCSSEILANEIKDFIENGGKLIKYGENAKKLALKDSAKVIVNEVINRC